MWLAAAQSKPWWIALTASYGGYVSLVANAAGVLSAHLVPLEQAPVVTLAIALAVQVLPALLVVSAGPLALRGTARTALALLVLLLAVPSEEVWLNTANATILLSLAAAIVLVSPAGGARWLERLTLVLAGLTGPVSAFLLPLFAARALFDRHRERVVQTAILGAGASVQLAAFLLRPAGRVVSTDVPALVAAMFVKALVLPLGGVEAAEGVGTALRDSLRAGAVSPLLIAAMAAALLAVVALVWLSGIAEARWSIAAASFILALSTAAAASERTEMLPGIHSSRYFFAPNALVGIALLAALAPATKLSRGLRAVAGALLAAIIVSGAYSFLRPAHWFSQGPSWRTEVERWRQDPAYLLSAWPAHQRAFLPRSVGPRPFRLREVRPATGPVTGGTDVLLIGSGLDGVRSILFGDAPAVRFHAFADGVALARVPPAKVGRTGIAVTSESGETSRLEDGFEHTAAVASFVASPAVLRQPGRTVLNWSVVGAGEVTVNGVGGVLPASGHTEVAVDETTSFELYPGGKGHQGSPKAVTVTVLPRGRGPLAAPDLTAPPERTAAGPSVEIAWRAVPGASVYEVRLFDSSDGSTVLARPVPSGDGSPSTTAGLLPGVHVAAVRACSGPPDEATCGEFGLLTFETSAAAPMSPPIVRRPESGLVLEGPRHLVRWDSPAMGWAGSSYEVAVEEVATGRPEAGISVPSTVTSAAVDFRRSGVYALRVRGCASECGPYSEPVHVLVRVPRVY
ncbi:MAG TPA: hypothetical protein VMR21_08475 [Vicinamibacteria bacterium]|nr:hypothetical protein [Vicinamibacteria bacterium]